MVLLHCRMAVRKNFTSSFAEKNLLTIKKKEKENGGKRKLKFKMRKEIITSTNLL